MDTRLLFLQDNMRYKEDMQAKLALLWELRRDPELIASHFVARLLLNKNKTGVTSSKDIRPIAVQNPIQKMYELTIADELKMFNARASPSLYGFKPQYATINNSTVIIKRVRYLIPKKFSRHIQKKERIIKMSDYFILKIHKKAKIK